MKHYSDILSSIFSKAALKNRFWLSLAATAFSFAFHLMINGPGRFSTANVPHCDTWYIFGLSLSPGMGAWSEMYHASRISMYLPQHLIYSFGLDAGIALIQPFALALATGFLFLAFVNLGAKTHTSLILSFGATFSPFALVLSSATYNVLDFPYLAFGVLLGSLIATGKPLAMPTKVYPAVVGAYLTTLYFYDLQFFAIALGYFVIQILEAISRGRKDYLKSFVTGLSLLSLGGVVGFFAWQSLFFLIVGETQTIQTIISQVSFSLGGSFSKNNSRELLSALIEPTVQFMILLLSAQVLAMIKIFKEKDSRRLVFVGSSFCLSIVWATYIFISGDNLLWDFQSPPFLLILGLGLIFIKGDLSSLGFVTPKSSNAVMVVGIILLATYLALFHVPTYISVKAFTSQIWAISFVGFSLLSYFVVKLNLRTYKQWLPAISLLFACLPLAISGNSYQGTLTNSPSDVQVAARYYAKVYDLHKVLSSTFSGSQQGRFAVDGPIDYQVSNFATAAYRSFWGGTISSCLPSGTAAYPEGPLVKLNDDATIKFLKN